MFTGKCKLYTLQKSKNNKYESVCIEDIPYDSDYMVLGTVSNGKSSHSSFYDIKGIGSTYIMKEIELLTITFENSTGVKRTVECTPRQMFVTHRGYVNPRNFNKTDVFKDDTGHVNRLVSVESRKVNGATIALYNVDLNYGATTYINGIQIK